METTRLWYLLEPSCLAMVATATAVVYCSARWAVQHEMRRSSSSWSSSSDQMLADASVTLDGFQAVLMPVAFSVSLLLMFYLFSFIQQLVTVLTAAAALSSLAFCITRVVPMGNRGWPVVVITMLIGLAWIVSASWLLNDVLGMSLCVAFVTHVRLPNVRVCVLLLSCLFVYDVFWVFVSERLFGANVMVSVATQQASNPVHTVANKLSLPLAGAIAEQLDLPVKILIPRHLYSSSSEFMMLGLGDMAIPGLLLALVLGFDHRKQQQQQGRRRYTWIVLLGYVLGLLLALAAGLVSRAAQPALLYLVPSTLIPVIGAAWIRGELAELWAGPKPAVNHKSLV